MTQSNRLYDFERAAAALEEGDYALLEKCLRQSPAIATERDETNATLLIRLIDYPGHRLNGAMMARLLLKSGAEVDARRNESNGTALAGAICTLELDTAQVLLENGADLDAPCGFCPGTAMQLALETKNQELIALVREYR